MTPAGQTSMLANPAVMVVAPLVFQGQRLRRRTGPPRFPGQRLRFPVWRWPPPCRFVSCRTCSPGCAAAKRPTGNASHRHLAAFFALMTAEKAGAGPGGGLPRLRAPVDRPSVVRSRWPSTLGHPAAAGRSRQTTHPRQLGRQAFAVEPGGANWQTGLNPSATGWNTFCPRGMPKDGSSGWPRPSGDVMVTPTPSASSPAKMTPVVARRPRPWPLLQAYRPVGAVVEIGATSPDP